MELGNLIKVKLANVWNDENKFNEWLASNLKYLADVIGLELELVNREERIGDFSADIIAKDVNTNKLVVIESQLTRSNHDHLGKIIAYASGIDASVVVWVSPEIREEHRSALDWLNNNTTKEVSFFGLEIELLKIDNSPPAPRFSIVSMPNTWKKHMSYNPSKRDLLYQEYFQELVNKLRQQRLTNAQRGSSQQWFSTGAGRSGFSYNFVFSRDMYRLELYIDTGDSNKNKQAFNLLLGDKNEIEDEIGVALIWDEISTARGSRIYAKYPDRVTIEDAIRDKNLRKNLLKWSIEMVRKFRAVFPKRIKNLSI